MTSQFNYVKIVKSAWFLLPFCHQVMSADSARFLLTIYWHNILAGFVDKSWTKCEHRWLRFFSKSDL